jgi:hypothetical protein
MAEYGELPKVVKILDGYEVVINRGSNDGIQPGAVFLLFGLDDIIVDPDTGEHLGRLELVRGRARVTHIQERLSTLESSERFNTSGTKKIIRRDAGRTLGLLGLGTTEEIEEATPDRLKQLNAQVGDYARPV